VGARVHGFRRRYKPGGDETAARAGDDSFQGRFVFVNEQPFIKRKRKLMKPFICELACWPVGREGLIAKTQGQVRGPSGGYLQMSSPLSKAFGSRSGGPGGSFHSLHHMPGLHLIRSQYLNALSISKGALISIFRNRDRIDTSNKGARWYTVDISSNVD
jgi:hypothetical protein